MERYDSANASPTPVAKPCPSGPVVMSIPNFVSNSGCPGVFEFNCLKFFMSSIDISNPLKCNRLYNNAEPCPALKTNLSLLIQSGQSFVTFKKFLYKTVPTSAIPKGMPG